MLKEHATRKRPSFMNGTRADAVLGRTIAMRLLAAGASAACVALSLAAPGITSLGTNQFVLIATDGKFSLQFDSRGKKNQISVPRQWLVPPDEEQAELSNYVSSFNYDRRITDFVLGSSVSKPRKIGPSIGPRKPCIRSTPCSGMSSAMGNGA